MGYQLYVTRKALWCDEDGSSIGIDEWRKLVLSDPEMRLDDFAETSTDKGRVRIESEGLSVWTAYSKHGSGGNMAWFDYIQAGSITVKNPDKEVRSKMYKIALKLNAKVQGDEGELYDAEGDLVKS